MTKNKLPKTTSCRGPAKSRPRSFHHGNLRQELVDAALAAPDIEGLSLRQLAASLGVTAAAAYRHFDSRENLLFEVARYGFDRLRQGFAAAFDIELPPSNAEEARQRLIRLAQAYLQFSDDEPALWRLMFGAQAEAYRKTANAHGGQTSYDYLPAALLGLHLRASFPYRPTNMMPCLRGARFMALQACAAAGCLLQCCLLPNSHKGWPGESSVPFNNH